MEEFFRITFLSARFCKMQLTSFMHGSLLHAYKASQMSLLTLVNAIIL